MNNEQIAAVIEKALPGAQVMVLSEDQRHFEVHVTWEGFSGKNLVEQHRMVNGALKEALEDSVHAIAIKTKVPE